MPLSFRPTTKDDRGKTVDAIDDRRLLREAGSRDSPRYQLALRLGGAVRDRSNDVTPLTLLVLLATLLACFAVSRLVPHTVQVAAIIGVSAIGGTAALYSTRNRLGSNLAASAVAEGVCGTCAYPLYGLTPEPDGCVVCAECGSAWKASRIVVAEGQSPPPPPRPHLLQREILGSTKKTGLLVPDDRGRFVTPLDSRLRRLAPQARESIRPAEYHEFRAAFRGVGNPLRAAIALPVGLITLFLLLLALAAGTDPAETLARIAIILVLGGGVTAGVLLADIGLTPATMRRILLERGRCPSCGTHLDATAQKDGFVVCRCGASWKAHDIAPLHASPVGSRPLDPASKPLPPGPP